jgi:WD40 repeat protein
LQYEDSSSDLYFLGTKFSHDSRYLACFTPRHYVGVIIFDWKINKIVSTIQVKSLISAVSFNPINNTRLCVTGACGLFQFWHFTSKSTYSAPINGLTNRTDLLSFNCHEWLETDVIIGGTDKGQLYLIIGCETKQSLHIFGLQTENTLVSSSPINGILVKDSLILAYSSEGYVALIRWMKSDGRHGNPAPHLKLECYFVLKEMSYICGVTWCERRIDSMMIAVSGMDSTLVYQLPITTEPSSQNAANGTNLAGNILIFTPHLLKRNEISLNEDDNFLDHDEDEDEMGQQQQRQHGVSPYPTTRFVTPPHSSRSTGPRQHGTGGAGAGGGGVGVPALPRALSSDRHKYIVRQSSDTSNATKRIRNRWPYLTATRLISSHHSGMITTLATNPRSSLLLSSSPKDLTVKIWDYNRVGGDGALVVSEDYSQRQNEFPNTIDMHPSGFFFVAGTDEHVVEYAITDSKYEVLRKIPIKTAILSPTGEPIMNSNPVSIVKYSTGGHLIAVATGRLIQIFEVYNLNYNTEKAGDPPPSPFRLSTPHHHLHRYSRADDDPH